MARTKGKTLKRLKGDRQQMTFRRAPFARLVYKILYNYRRDMRIKPTAIEALQEASEFYFFTKVVGVAQLGTSQPQLQLTTPASGDDRA
jgi:histone H3/H4